MFVARNHVKKINLKYEKYEKYLKKKILIIIFLISLIDFHLNYKSKLKKKLFGFKFFNFKNCINNN